VKLTTKLVPVHLKAVIPEKLGLSRPNFDLPTPDKVYSWRWPSKKGQKISFDRVLDFNRFYIPVFIFFSFLCQLGPQLSFPASAKINQKKVISLRFL